MCIPVCRKKSFLSSCKKYKKTTVKTNSAMFLFQSSGFLLAEGRQCCQLQLRAVTAGSRVRVLGKLCQWQWDEARNFYTSSLYIYIHLWEGNWVFYYIIHVHTCIIEYRYMHCQRNKHKLLPVLRLI